MPLSDVFAAAVQKRLVAVDLPARGSNQHELNGSEALRRFFGASEPLSGSIQWTLFSEESDPFSSDGGFTFYDARARSGERTGRSEWRMYYRGEALASALPGDLLVIVRTQSGDYHGLVFQQGSGWERAALLIFPACPATGLVSFDALQLSRLALDATQRAILDQLGLDYGTCEADERLSLVDDLFGRTFPSTAEMGELARSRVVGVSDPDGLLLAWLDEEELLFRALERLVVGDRLETRFDSVDEFVSYSLSVQNRRKSRAGHAFENHLAALFTLEGVHFSRQVRTERNRTADFVFPGATEYHDPGFPSPLLTVLAAKTTCKDRWPQVLADADRIATKYLVTLDVTLSDYQLADMIARDVLPVMPASLAAGYGAASSGRIARVADFLEVVRGRES